MSEFGGLWKHENHQHTLVPPKKECGCLSGGGIKNGHMRYPSYGETQLKKKVAMLTTSFRHTPVRIFHRTGGDCSELAFSAHHWGE